MTLGAACSTGTEVPRRTELFLGTGHLRRRGQAEELEAVPAAAGRLVHGLRERPVDPALELKTIQREDAISRVNMTNWKRKRKQNWVNGIGRGKFGHSIDLRPAVRLLDEKGNLYSHVHIFVNGRDACYLEKEMDTVIQAEDTLNIFPPVGGG